MRLIAPTFWFTYAVLTAFMLYTGSIAWGFIIGALVWYFLLRATHNNSSRP